MKNALALWIAFMPLQSYAGDIDLALITAFEVLVTIEARIQTDIEKQDEASLLAAEVYSKCLQNAGGNNAARCDDLAYKFIANDETNRKLKSAQLALESRTNAVISHAASIKKIQYEPDTYRACLSIQQRNDCNEEFIRLLKAN